MKPTIHRIVTSENYSSSHSSSPYLVKVPDQRKLWLKFFHTAHAAVRELCRTFALIGPRVRYRIKRPIEYAKCNSSRNGASGYDPTRLPWNVDNKPSEGLYVFIHGCLGTPVTWGKYLKQIHRNQPEFHCFAPEVYRLGNCPLKEASQPILNAIYNYAKKHPGKPIYLVGVSNGARIAAYLERTLRLENTTIKLASIAGIHYGTKIFNTLVRYHLQKLTRIHPHVIEDFLYGNAQAKLRLDKWRSFAQNTDAHRTRLFYTTTEDDKVRSIESTLPKISATDHHYYIHGHSHNSIVNAVRDHLLKVMSDEE